MKDSKHAGQCVTGPGSVMRTYSATKSTSQVPWQMHLRSLVLSPWLCFLASEDANVPEDQDLHYSSSQLFLLKFHSWHFSLSQLHVVWSCPQCYHLGHSHLGLAFSLPLTFPASDPSNSCPDSSRSQTLIFSLLCKEPSDPIRMTFNVLNSVKAFCPSASTFLQPH